MKIVIDTTKFDKALLMLTKRAMKLENLVLELQANAFYVNKVLEEAKRTGRESMRGGELNAE